MSRRLIAVAVLCCLGLTGNATPSPKPNNHAPCKKSSAEKQMVKLPLYKNSWQIQQGCGFPKARQVSFAIHLFYTKWLMKFGDEDLLVLKTLNNLMVEWGDKKKPIPGGAFDVNGNPIVGTARGLTLMPGYIWIWKNEYNRIAATALIHELVHSALWSQSGLHGDPDHEGEEFVGWTPAHTELIREINNLLAKLDI